MEALSVFFLHLFVSPPDFSQGALILSVIFGSTYPCPGGGSFGCVGRGGDEVLQGGVGRAGRRCQVALILSSIRRTSCSRLNLGLRGFFGHCQVDLITIDSK